MYWVRPRMEDEEFEFMVGDADDPAVLDGHGPRLKGEGVLRCSSLPSWLSIRELGDSRLLRQERSEDTA